VLQWHGEVLQLVVTIELEVLVQAVPPFWAGVVMTYTDVLTPPPQVLEHAIGACQLPTQLMGHGEVLQLVVVFAEVLVHVTPPYWGAVVMTYTEVLVPFPQVLEHALGACQLPTQLMGHGDVLHVEVITAPVLAQAVPP
jgi:hypothetical protein